MTKKFFVLLAVFAIILGGCQMNDEPPVSTASIYNLTDTERKNLVQEANNKNNEASFRLYMYYAFSEYDSTQELYWLKKSAADGNVVAQYNVAYFLEQLNKTEEALYWLELAANNGDNAAKKKMERFVRIQSKGKMNNGYSLKSPLSYNLTHDEKQKLVKAANKYDNNASLKLYLYYVFIEPNANQDSIWLYKSAEDGNSVAQYILACDYGSFVDVDKKLHWLKIAADNNFEPAKRELERIERLQEELQMNEGYPLSEFRASQKDIENWTEEANNGNNKAGFRLYIYHDFSYQNAAKDSLWLRKSATDGNSAAQYIIGCDLESMGEIDEAISWLKLAAANGHESAKKKLTSLGQKLKTHLLNK
jgi:TPR repeat protein